MHLRFNRNGMEYDDFEIADETEPDEERELLPYHPMPDSVKVPKSRKQKKKNEKL